MADFTTTSNLNLKKPAVGGSSDKWGEYLNSDLDTIDTEIQSLKTASTSRSLESLSNVLDTTPTTGQLLQYDTANWKAATVTIPDGIEDLSNVTVSSPADGQVLAYSASNSRWENQTAGAATIPDGTITTAKLSTSLQGQVNLILQTTGTPTDDQILRYNTNTLRWEFQDLPGGTISALSDTDVSAISNKDVLVYNSTSGDWVSRPLAIADVTGLQAQLDAKLESSDLSVSSLTDTTITTTADNSVLVYDASDSKWKNEGPSTARSSLGLGTLATQSTITESQISDLQSYLTAETNDLSSAVTWANVPDANITESSVTQHESALTITESQISDLGSYITASSTDTLTNKSGNISQWTNDSGYLTAETNDLSAVTGTLAIGNGGTGQTTAAAARVALLPTLGTAGQVLAVNTGTTDVEWVDASSGGGTDVTLAGSIDYLTISGQEITLHAINLTTDVTGTLPIATGGTGATTASAARIALGLEIGTDVQSYDVDTTKNDVVNTFSANQIISVESASDALRITQAGAGNALVVEDTTNPDSTPFVINAVGQVGIGTDSPTEKLDVTGNINASGTLTLGTALAVAEGGTGVTALSSLDAADLGSSTATDGYVLTADGSGGAAWEAVSGGGGSGTSYIEHSDTVSDSLAISSGTNRLYVGGTTFSDSATMAGRLVVAGGHANFTGTMNFTGTLNVIG